MAGILVSPWSQQQALARGRGSPSPRCLLRPWLVPDSPMMPRPVAATGWPWPNMAPLSRLMACSRNVPWRSSRCAPGSGCAQGPRSSKGCLGARAGPAGSGRKQGSHGPRGHPTITPGSGAADAPACALVSIRAPRGTSFWPDPGCVPACGSGGRCQEQNDPG